MVRRLTTEEFIVKAKEVHGDTYYYDRVLYKASGENVIITCKIHGDFLQTPNHHLKGRGCHRCFINFKLTTEEFISKAKNVHGDLYDYDKTDYKRSLDKVTIACKKHGDFLQTPNNHLKGKGCPACSKFTKEEFISRAREVHGNLYDYTKAVYKNSRAKVIITCKKHGDYEQSPADHLQKCGCPRCATSGFSIDRPAIFYILDIYGDIGFTGFGISNEYKNRKRTHKRNLKSNNYSIIGEMLIASNGDTIQELEKYIKQTLQCNSSDIEGFKTESVLIPPEALLNICKEWLIANGKEFTINS